MDTVLYHPEFGYYSSPEPRVGHDGDYYTSVSVHPLFAACIADQMAQMWQLLGRPSQFTIVECGAGSGELAQQVLASLAQAWPQLWQDCRYWLVEMKPSAAEALLTLDSLAPGRVAWSPNLNGLSGPVVGCVLSNELVDAFPVHRVRKRDGVLRELFVVEAGGRLAEAEGEPSDPELERYFVDLGIELEDGQEAEVNLAARAWLDEVASKLERGFILTVDYGYEARDLYGPRFPKGTLVGYRKHRLVEDWFASLGCQDLTSHVCFTALRQWGERVGLAFTGLTTQSRFLLSMGILEKLARLDAKTTVARYRDIVAVKQLVAPAGMGEAFKVLIQHKGVESPELRGLQSPWTR